MSLQPGVKTTRFRNDLRHAIAMSGWHRRPWSCYVLGIECIQGWAGRKNASGATMLHVYCTTHFRAQAIKEMANLLEKIGLPPFNLVPIRFYTSEIEANRIPKGDTQDRFWLVGGYNALNIGHWDHWVQTKRYWNTHFKPSAEEALKIMQDLTLFKAMLAQDWERQEHYGEASLWTDLVPQFHQQWPVYSSLIQMHNDDDIKDLAAFTKAHLHLREQYLTPNHVEVLMLP